MLQRSMFYWACLKSSECGTAECKTWRRNEMGRRFQSAGWFRELACKSTSDQRKENIRNTHLARSFTTLEIWLCRFLRNSARLECPSCMFMNFMVIWNVFIFFFWIGLFYNTKQTFQLPPLYILKFSERFGYLLLKARFIAHFIQKEFSIIYKWLWRDTKIYPISHSYKNKIKMWLHSMCP